MLGEALVLPNRNSTALLQNLLVWYGCLGCIAWHTPLRMSRCHYCYHTASSHIREYPGAIIRDAECAKSKWAK